MRDSERYALQAETVMRLAARATSEAEREVYLSIADGWRKLSTEAERNERQAPDTPQPKKPPRSFRSE